MSRQRQQTHGAIHRGNDISQVLDVFSSDFGQMPHEATDIRQQVALQDTARIFESLTTKSTKVAKQGAAIAAPWANLYSFLLRALRFFSANSPNPNLITR